LNISNYYAILSYKMHNKTDLNISTKEMLSVKIFNYYKFLTKKFKQLVIYNYIHIYIIIVN